MKRPKHLPVNMVHYYNAFVDVANFNNLLFNKVDVGIGETEEGIKGLRFEIDTSRGLTDEEAEKIFGEFIKKYPECSINYTLREVTAIEKSLYNIAETVLVMHDGIKLEKITTK